MFDRKKCVADKLANFCAVPVLNLVLNQRRLEVIEINALKRFIDVKLARFAVETEAVPVENAVSGVGVLLNFENDVSGADGVQTATGQEHDVTGFDRNAMDMVGDGSVFDSGFKFGACDAAFESDKEVGFGRGVGDVPHFGLRFAAELLGDVCRRMDLDGEFFLGVEDFDEEGKAGLLRDRTNRVTPHPGPLLVKGRGRTLDNLGIARASLGDSNGTFPLTPALSLWERETTLGRAEQFVAMFFHEPAKGFAGQRAVSYFADVAGPIGDFPRFTDGNVRGQLLAVKALYVAPTPDAFFEDGTEFEGVEHLRGQLPIVSCELGRTGKTETCY